jgi:iron complex outermembrane receptor protein
MRLTKFLFLTLFLMLISFPAMRVTAQEQQEEGKQIVTSEKIQVTATRIPEAVEPEPASITIVTGEELRDTGASNLSQALSLVSGVSIARGGDGGPASSVPEFWGLREFDAFLLVVDNVPWGGAFAPALATIDLNDIERIEVMRGAAPVMYGATSFVGVIHIIHRAASSRGNSAHAYARNYTTGGGAARFTLPSSGKWKQALSANFDSQGYRDDRTGYNLGHFLYRAERPAEAGLFHFDADLTFLRQDPASPHPREGTVLTPLVPLDANHNPSDSKQDENRYHFVGGFNRELMGSDWAILLAFTHADRDITKGFLSAVSNTEDPNTAGYRQTQNENDLYFDTHFSWKANDTIRFIFGGDYLYGNGDAKAENFDYFVNLDGSNPPDSFSEPVQERPQLKDTRNFFGLYGQVEWNPTPRWLFQGGVRLNSTHEKRVGEALARDPDSDSGGTNAEPLTTDTRTTNRLSGVVGVSYLALSNGRDNLWIFGDYRNSFKPAVVDFGPEAEGDILEPETAQSYEAGVKGESFEGRLDWEASIFSMDFKNLVTSALQNGLPILINSGTERFRGFEFESDVRVRPDTRIQFAYSHHSAKFRDFVMLFDDVPTQLAGKKLEMSPDNLAAVGLVYGPSKGPIGSFVLNYIGDRFLNKRNTALAKSFVTVGLGVGYRFGRNTVRLDIDNVTDRRDPVAESELGDAQYYRQPARNFRVGWQVGF